MFYQYRFGMSHFNHCYWFIARFIHAVTQTMHYSNQPTEGFLQAVKARVMVDEFVKWVRMRLWAISDDDVIYRRLMYRRRNNVIMFHFYVFMVFTESIAHARCERGPCTLVIWQEQGSLVPIIGQHICCTPAWRHIWRIQISWNILPLFWSRFLANKGHSIPLENFEPLTFVANVWQNNLAVWPKCRRQKFQFKFTTDDLV